MEQIKVFVFTDMVEDSVTSADVSRVVRLELETVPEHDHVIQEMSLQLH